MYLTITDIKRIVLKKIKKKIIKTIKIVLNKLLYVHRTSVVYFNVILLYVGQPTEIRGIF